MDVPAVIRRHVLRTIAVLSGLSCSTIVCAQSEGLLIRGTKDGVIVEKISLPPAPTDRWEGLLIWSPDAQTEQWHWWTPAASWPLASVAEANAALASGVRSVGNSPGSLSLMQGTQRLAQLATSVAQRGKLGQFFTPLPGGTSLSRTPTFRRASDDGSLPAATVTILDSGNGKVAAFPMAQGISEMPWREIKDLPASFADGLPAGEYRIKLGDDSAVTSFLVADDKERKKVLEDVTELAELLDPHHSELVAQFQVQTLLSVKSSQGRPLYLADAIDRIDGVKQPRSPFLSALRQELLDQAARLAVNPAATAVTAVPALDGETGLPKIDEIRRLISVGSLSEADAALSAYKPADSRGAGLQRLYQAVVHSEAGSSRQDAALAAFEEATQLLASSSSEDRLRVAINASGFQLRLVQDRLNNHTFRIATGGERPIQLALEGWIAAEATGRAALGSARAAKSSSDIAASHLNLARAQALLADAITMLSLSSGEAEKCDELVRRAMSDADREIQEARKETGAAQWTGLAAEMQANLAFRRRDVKTCRKRIDEGLNAYIAQGSLPGAESLFRLSGLVALEARDRQQALRDFEASHLISELLRNQFPADQLGLGRAGFFSRRGYVYEQLVDLLVEAGESKKALYYAELAKARSAQDLLTMRGVPADSAAAAVPQADLLARWPAGVAALEYFIGERRVYGFLVDTEGTVTSWVLASAPGEPLDSQTLIRDVKTFLAGIESQSVKMRRMILTGRGLDRTWQDDLHRFYNQFIPEAVRPALQKARQVVVVPHHVLHYFPFAALVTERDTKERGKLEMISPKFLVDASFDVLYAPSLGVWDMLSRSDATRRTANAIGIVEVPGAPPLPGVALDLQNFRDVFGDSVKTVVEGDAATTSRVKAVLAEKGILLIATHGMNEPDHPLDSYLLFIPSEEEQGGFAEGNLRARHILTTPVNASMVVMSACFSGLGDRTPPAGDDLFGLQRAFLMKGVRTVVSGLWDVYDGTAPELIRGYFERIHQGLPASKALADSQRNFLNRLRSSGKSELYLHPYFWAVYTVAGNDGAVPAP